jgi:hypothetical protein
VKWNSHRFISSQKEISNVDIKAFWNLKLITLNKYFFLLVFINSMPGGQGVSVDVQQLGV